MTKQIYFGIAICVIVIAIYFTGVVIGRAKCQAQIATAATNATQQQMIKKEKINAEVFNTGMRDIRDVLRTKYTIAD